MLKKVLIGVVAVVAALVLVGFLLPGQVHVERSVVINASADKVFPMLCDFEKTHTWSPWMEMEPEAKNTYTGAPCAVDHANEWSGEKVGQGKQWIVAITDNASVKTKLDFGEQGTADAEFVLSPEGEGTKVTWKFDTDLGANPIGRWFGLMMDGMIGGDYERGLSNLKAKLEG